MSNKTHTVSIVNFLCSDTVEERSTEYPDTYCKNFIHLHTRMMKNLDMSILWLLRSQINAPFNGRRAHCLDHKKNPQCKCCTGYYAFNCILVVLIEPRNKIFSAPKDGIYKECCIPAQPYMDGYDHDIYPTLTSKDRDHTPIRTRAGIHCGIGNCRKEKHVQRRHKHECAVQHFCLVGYHQLKLWRWRTGTNYKPDEDDLYDTWIKSSYLETTMAATYEGYHAFTAPTWLGPKEPDQLTACNTVESERVLFAPRSMQKERPGILHESDSCAKKHRT